MIVPPMIDEHAANDLELFIENEAALYPQRQAIWKNLATKKVRSQYKHELAVKLFGYLVESGAKKYVKEFSSTLPWHKMFNVPTRKRVAEELTKDFEGEFELGNYDHLLPKKYQKEMMGVGGKVKFPSAGRLRSSHATCKHGKGCHSCGAGSKTPPAQLDREIAAVLSSSRGRR